MAVSFYGSNYHGSNYYASRYYGVIKAILGGASSLGLIDDEEVVLISNLFMQYMQKVKK